MADITRGQNRRDQWPNDDRFRDKGNTPNYQPNFNNNTFSRGNPNQGYRGRGFNRGQFTQPPRTNMQPNDGKCFYCGIPGHYKSECRRWMRESGRGGMAHTQQPMRAIEGPKPPPRQDQHFQ